MARTVEDIVKIQLGEQAIQIASLVAQNEALIERVKELEGQVEKDKEEE